jgi:hypothetical protein
VTKKLSLDAPVKPTQESAPLVEIIELKWLMSGMGMHMHVERLQADREYAVRTLAEAEASTNEALRLAAGRLRFKLGLAAA